MKTVPLADRLLTGDLLELHEYLADFRWRYKRWPTRKDVGERFKLKAEEAAKRLTKLQKLGYARPRLAGVGIVEFVALTPVVGEVA